MTSDFEWYRNKKIPRTQRTKTAMCTGRGWLEREACGSLYGLGQLQTNER